MIGNVLNPTHGVRDDFVPATDYTSVSFAAQEYQHVWSNVWQLACREEDLLAVGDYVTYEIIDQSIIILRNAEGITAFHNVCQHRGRRLKNSEEPAGNTSGGLFCRYHGWRWTLFGELAEIPSIDDWRGCAGFGKDDLRLAKVRIGIWGGWIWVNLGEDPKSLEEFLAPVPEYLDCFEFEKMRTVWHHSIVVPANWKTVLEAFAEAYHAPATHPQTASFDRDFGSGPSRTIVHGVHSQMRLGAPLSGPVPPRIDFRRALNSSISAMVEQFKAMYFEPSIAAGQRVLAELPREATYFEVIAAQVEFTRQRMEELGIDWPEGLTFEALDKAGFDFAIFPNTILLPTIDGVVQYRTRPWAGGPDHCIWDIRCFARFSPGKEPAYEPSFFSSPEEFSGNNYFLEQDLSNVAEVQLGMHSKGFKGLRTNPLQESSISNLHRALHKMIESGSGEALPAR